MFPNEFHRSPKDALYCVLCQKNINFETIDKVKSHRNSKYHQNKLTAIDKYSPRQPGNLNLYKPDIVINLLDTFVSTNIPLYKIRSLKWVNFLSNTLNISISETELRRKLVSLTSSKINKIKKNFLINHYLLLWMNRQSIT